MNTPGQGINISTSIESGTMINTPQNRAFDNVTINMEGSSNHIDANGNDSQTPFLDLISDAYGEQ